jgi:hypothetical protein
LNPITETKTVAGEKGQLVEYAWKLEKRGLKEKTIEIRMFLLNQLLKLGVDLSNPDTVETTLATEKFTAAKKTQISGSLPQLLSSFSYSMGPNQNALCTEATFRSFRVRTGRFNFRRWKNNRNISISRKRHGRKIRRNSQTLLDRHRH